MTSDELERLYGNRIGEDSILSTGSHKSYMQFAIDMKLEHKKIKRGRHKKDIYHIQHINNLHSSLKRWMSRFNGVATKYLSNYLKWNKCINTFNTEKETVRTKNLIVHSNIIHSYTMKKNLRSESQYLYKVILFP